MNRGEGQPGGFGSENFFIRFQGKKLDTYRTLLECFRRKVQLAKDTDDNEADLQFYRGTWEAMVDMEKMFQEVQKLGQPVAPSPVQELLRSDFKGLAMNRPDLGRAWPKDGGKEPAVKQETAA